MQLPACVGFALVSPTIGDLVLGPNFRQLAHQTMPILSLSVMFQILAQQYLHTSFLLSKRNSFYLLNTASTLLFNLPVAFLLISRYGIMGAVWARFVAEIFGFLNALVLSRMAFKMPFPARSLGRIGVVVRMSLAIDPPPIASNANVALVSRTASVSWAVKSGCEESTT